MYPCLSITLPTQPNDVNIAYSTQPNDVHCFFREIVQFVNNINKLKRYEYTSNIEVPR